MYLYIQRVKEKGDEKGGLGPRSSNPKDPHKGLHYSAQRKIATNFTPAEVDIPKKKLQSAHFLTRKLVRNHATHSTKPCSPKDTICMAQFARCAIHSRSRVNPHKELKGNQATQSTRYNQKMQPGGSNCTTAAILDARTMQLHCEAGR